MSRIRITGGRLRGRWLAAPTGNAVRPTSSRVREAVFSILGQDLSGQAFLDCCCGSGIMAAEAYSRGATVTALEKEGRRAKQLQRVLADIAPGVTVLRRDARRPLDGAWDVAFIDPPYALDPTPFIAARAEATPWVLVEAEARREAPEGVGGLVLERVRAFGDTAIWEYRR